MLDNCVSADTLTPGCFGAPSGSLGVKSPDMEGNWVQCRQPGVTACQPNHGRQVTIAPEAGRGGLALFPE
jgi:hypothetical protein